MPFGLCNAAQTFQRIIESALHKLQWHISVLYLDDIIVIGKSFKEHLNDICKITDRPNLAWLKLKPMKCTFFRHELQFWGHVVSSNGVKRNPKKKAVSKMKTPGNVKEFRSFLGLVSNYRKFIKNFSLIAKSQFELTKPSVTWNCSEECDIAFHTLKDNLVTSPILSYPDVNGGEFILDTYASHCKLPWDYQFVAPPKQGEIGEPVVIASVNKNKVRSKTNEKPDITLTSSLIREMQSQDTELGDLLKLKIDSAGKPAFENFTSKSALFKNWIQNWELLTVQGDLLCYYWEDQNGTNRWKICTTKALKRVCSLAST
ncbi:unnamed protein product [Mytilus coruscus]|uniref:Reverse transcriptase domain-containing protein n=1 Tax=Mytilus coruscus TaxID=42192 RepID=A0A6J8AM23_MYTCO|nr:unnamed protein product [Mytilus coruscus]